MSQRPSLVPFEPNLLTVKETQESLGVSRATFYRLVRAGRIKPSTRRGGGRGRMFFDVNEIHDYLLGNYHEPVPEEPTLPEPEPEPAPEAPKRRSRSHWQTGELT